MTSLMSSWVQWSLLALILLLIWLVMIAFLVFSVHSMIEIVIDWHHKKKTYRMKLLKEESK